MSSLSGRTSNKNIPKFPNDIGTAGQFIKLKNDVNDGFEYTDAGNISLPIASNTTLGGVKIDGNNLAINSAGLLSVTGIPSVTGFITASSTDTLTNKSMTKAQISDFPSIPTKTSDLTNDNGFIIASSSIDNTLIKTTKQEIIGDMTDNFTTPQLYIRPASVSGRDTTLTLEGRRNNGASKSTYLYFNNFDDNDGASGSTAIMGLISGHISNATDNTGDLRFYTSSNGANLNECLRLASDNKATFSSNVTFNNAPKDAQGNPYITTTSTNTLTNKSITKAQISDFPTNAPNFEESIASVTDGKFLRVDTVGGNKVVSYDTITFPTNAPNFEESIASVTDGKFLRVDTVGGNKVVSYETVTFPTNAPNFEESIASVTDGKFLKVKTVSGAKVVSYETVTFPANAPNFEESIASVTDGKFLRVDTVGGNKVVSYETVTFPTNAPNFEESIASVTDGKFLKVKTVSGAKVVSYDTVTFPTNAPNFEESIANVTDGKFLRVDTVGGNKVVSYDTVTIPSGNKLVPDITNNGYFLKSVIVPDGGPESLSWAQVTIPSGSNNFLEDYSQANSINLKSTGSNIELQVGSLGTRFQIEAGGRILGSSNMCIESNVGSNVNSTLVPSLLIKTISNTGNDVAVSLRGSRNSANNRVSSKLRFENYDHDFADIGLMGSIHGFIRNKNDNVGDLRFYTSNDGSAENECLTMNGNSNFIGIGVTIPTEKLDVNGNIKSSGVITGVSYVGLPIASNESVGTVIISNSGSLNINSGLLSVDKTTSVTSGSASLVTSGGVFTKINALSLTQTRQLIETFAVTQQTDLIGSASQVTFNKSISNTNGITHNSGTAIPQNSLFNVIESGLYIFNISLDVTGVGSARSFVSADIQVYTGSSFSSRGSLFQSPYAIGSAYVRANDGQTNKGTINSCLTIFLDAGRQFEIIGRKIYRSGNSGAQVQVQNSSYMTIERIVNSLT